MARRPTPKNRSEIAALSATELEQLKSGVGMGLARAAELNHFPGPKHLLEIGEHFGLTEEQTASMEATQARILEEAISRLQGLLSVVHRRAHLEVTPLPPTPDLPSGSRPG
jgi:hypothetical protein